MEDIRTFTSLSIFLATIKFQRLATLTVATLKLFVISFTVAVALSRTREASCSNMTWKKPTNDGLESWINERRFTSYRLPLCS